MGSLVLHCACYERRRQFSLVRRIESNGTAKALQRRTEIFSKANAETGQAVGIG